MSSNPGPSPAAPIGALLIVAGLVALFIKTSAAIGLIALGIVILFVGYKLQGGSSNPNLYRPPEDVHREWMKDFDSHDRQSPR